MARRGKWWCDWEPERDRKIRLALMPSKEDIVRRELSKLAPLVEAAIKYLRRVTGKRFMTDINPLNEKRWSKRCWDCWETVWRVDVMMLFRRPWWEVEQSVITSDKILDSWSGEMHPDAPVVRRYGTTNTDDRPPRGMAPRRTTPRRHS